jgi:hypothetical protein
MNESHGLFDQLSNRVDDLERRVRALEHPEGLKAPATQSHRKGTAHATPKEGLQTGTFFSVLGRAMLGVAGAYALRAVTTTGAAPGLLVSAIAVVYAFGWLIWALRTSQTLARYVYAGTSALILAPMLWEVTLHFHVVTPIAAAGILAGYVTLATVAEARDGKTRTAWIVQGTAVAIAASLAFATHHVLPFLLTLLIAVFVSEYIRVLDYSEPAWPLMALVTDVVIWGTIFIYAGPQSARGDYPDLPMISLVMPGCLLFLINGTGFAVRARLKQSRVSIFEAIQMPIAFLLAIASVLFFVPAHAQMVAGVTCLVLAGAIYPATFLWLHGLVDQRNYRVFGTWSAALLIAGALWSLPRGAAAMLLATAACAAYAGGARFKSRMLELHGAVFLCAGVAVSEMPRYVFGALASSLPGRPAMSVVVLTTAATLAFVEDRDLGDGPGLRRALQFIPAFVSVCGASALLAHGMLALFSFASMPEAHHVAFVRTLTISLVSMSLAFAGSRWGWLAMTRLAYVALVFVAAKLLFEDMQHGHMAFIAGSIFLFAITLIAVPRLVRWGTNARHAHSPGVAAPGRV